VAWSTPLTAVANSALTAAQWNASVRDNLLGSTQALATTAGQLFVSTGVNAIAARSPAQADVTTSETTTSSSFTDLTTTGPAVTATTGTRALVFITCQMNNSTANFSVVGCEVTGASSSSPDDSRSLVQDSTAGNFEDVRATATHLYTGLTAGSNTFTLKYRVGGGTGQFQRRSITVIPL
jgi:hypothetical protein